MRFSVAYSFVIIITSLSIASAQSQKVPPSNEIPGTVQTVLGADGRLTFIFIPDAPLKAFSAPELKAGKAEAFAWEKGIIDASAFPTDKATAFKVTSDKGKFAGYWVGAETPESAFALQNAVSPGWNVEKVGLFNPKALGATSTPFPIPEAEVMESLRKELFTRAKDLACKSSIRPKEVAVTASLQASIGLIVGGAGTISFQATWESEKLCS